MYKLVWDDSFLRKLRRLTKNNPEIESIFRAKIEILELEPYHPSLKTHKLQGRLKSYLSCSLNYTYRLVFKLLDDSMIQLIDIGTHDEVY